MKNTVALLLGVAVSISTFSGNSAQALTLQTEGETRTITTVIEAIFYPEGQMVVRLPNNGGKGLKITNLVDFPAEKIQKIEQAFANRSSVKLVVQGQIIIDVL